MKYVRTLSTAVLLGASVITMAPAHAEEPVQAINPPYSTDADLEQPDGWITPAPSIYTEAMKHGEEIAGPVYFAPNGVPFAKTASGLVIIGDGEDSAHTQTWVPWTDRVEYLGPDSSTVSLLSHRGPNSVGGAIAGKYLTLGGEARYGRSTSPELTKPNGAHAGATPVQVQTFGKAEAHWTKDRGAHMVGGAIHKKWTDLGGLRGLGASVTDERQVTVNGKVFTRQDFQRGTIDWSKDTGAIRR
jgi:uncharacterized protein with LGFP repeats